MRADPQKGFCHHLWIDMGVRKNGFGVESDAVFTLLDVDRGVFK
jgi:hypothetical protein